MKKLYLVDGSNHAFRVFFALPKMTANGMHTGALLGFANMLKKLEREHQPDYMAVVFDKGKSFRNDLYPEYKGHRPDMPAELREQWPKFPGLVEAWGYPSLALEGVEADDVIGTMAQWATESLEVTIVSGDKDFYQLIRPQVRILDIMKDKIIAPDDVRAKFGVGPEGVIDVLAMAGDSSDNVPGVSGIGAKTAAKLMDEYGSLEEILQHAPTIKGKRGATLVEEADIARLSKQLVTIKTDVSLSLQLNDLTKNDGERETLRQLFVEWQFRTHLKDLLSEPSEDGTPDLSGLPKAQYVTVSNIEELRIVVEDIKKTGAVSLDLETTSLDPLEAQIVGIALCSDDSKASYIPVSHTTEGIRRPDQLSLDTVINELHEVLNAQAIKKIGQNLKYDVGVLESRGYTINGIHSDTMLLDYLLEPERNRHSLDDLSLRYLGHKMMSYDEVTRATGKDHFSEVPIDEATKYAAEDAHVAWVLHQKLWAKAERNGLLELFEDLERPVSQILGRMERSGIGIDLEQLKSLSDEFGTRLKEIEGRIYFLAGREFTISSPKQLQVVLFEERGLKPVKKTKTGFSTDADTLEALAMVDPLPAQILSFRSLAKLKSTYADTLPGMVSNISGRIHTSFHQAVTATGRLSSNNPNLQNIPIRGDDGRRIRKCFVARPGHVFLSCDYSQIELRVLAHYCEKGPLVESFIENQDIHRRTASEIFGISFESVSPDQRSAAKAINFGIVYGMSAFRLSNELRISRKQAQAYLDNYWSRYPQVQEAQRMLIAKAQEKGYAETLWGRRRHIPDINSSNGRERAAAERIALNTPMQGTAADIIKKAMILVFDEIQVGNIPGTLLLQVHDELLLEVPQEAAEETAQKVTSTMESSASLRVPLVVNSGWATDWAGAH